MCLTERGKTKKEEKHSTSCFTVWRKLQNKKGSLFSEAWKLLRSSDMVDQERHELLRNKKTMDSNDVWLVNTRDPGVMGLLEVIKGLENRLEAYEKRSNKRLYNLEQVRLDWGLVFKKVSYVNLVLEFYTKNFMLIYASDQQLNCFICLQIWS